MGQPSRPPMLTPWGEADTRLQTMTMNDYSDFIASKSRAHFVTGFDPVAIKPHLFDFQRAIVEWACKRGRAAIFADTGLGKTAMQSEWARQVAGFTGGRVLILAPLCVAQQTVEEEARFGTTIKYCRDESQAEGDIIITNYEMVEHFDIASYAGVVIDESSILKSHDSKTRAKIIELFRDTPYKLSCTATPSPNDHMELGNQAEFLGVMTAVEMLAMFFVHAGGDTSQWSLKGHGFGSGCRSGPSAFATLPTLDSTVTPTSCRALPCMSMSSSRRRHCRASCSQGLRRP